MVFIIFVVAIVLTVFVSAAIFAPLWGLGALMALAVTGIAWGGYIGSRYDEVKGSMGIFSALLLGLSTVVAWIVVFVRHLA